MPFATDPSCSTKIASCYASQLLGLSEQWHDANSCTHMHPSAMQILAVSTVVWISEWRSESEPDNPSPAGPDAAWQAVSEGPLFLCSRAQAPHYVLIIKTRSQHSGVCGHALLFACSGMPCLQYLHH